MRSLPTEREPMAQPDAPLMTELRCMARHPLAKVNPRRFGRRVCGAFIIELPFPCEPTGRVLEASAEVRAGMIPGKCPKCSHVTEYEVLPPSQP